MVKKLFKPISIILMLIIMALTFSACASVRAQVITNADNTIDETSSDEVKVENNEDNVGEEVISNIDMEAMKEKATMELFREFFEKQAGCELSPMQEQIMTDIIEKNRE